MNNKQTKKTKENIKYKNNSHSKGKRSIEKNKNPKKKKVWKKVLLCIVILLVVFAGFITYSTIKNGGGLQGLLATILGHNSNTLKDLPKIEFLAMGESGNMTDTILVCSYDPKTQQASMLSIPRDTFVGKSQKRATASDKINAIYNSSNKNPEKTLDKVNDLAGLNLKYYAVIDANALKELVDTIGGVDYYVPIDMDYDDTSKENFLRIHLKQGQQKLNGEQAEGLVRFRHNNDGSTYPSEYGEQDIGRMRTQREFLAAVMKQTLTPGNIFKIGNFVEIAHKNLKTNMPLSLVKDYVPYAVNFSTENLRTETFPGTPEKLNGVWFYLQNEEEAEKIVTQLFRNTTQEQNTDTNTTNTTSNETTNTQSNTSTSSKKAESKSDLRIEVLNGSTKSSNLTKVTNLLKERGYNVVKVGNTTATSKTSIINRTNQSSKLSSGIKKSLGYGTITTGKDNSKVDFTVIIGKDYKQTK